MNIKTTRTWTVVLVAVLALSLLLTACGNGGNSPTGDNTTPGVTDTQTPDNTPSVTDPTDATDEPDNTPGAAEKPSNTEPRHPEPTEYNEELKAAYDEAIANINDNAGIDIDNVLDEVNEQYGEYLNVNITKNAVRVGIITTGTGPVSRNNISGITTEALNEVNDFLITNGEESLDIKDHKQSIAALWLAASLYFGLDDPMIESGEYGSYCFDIAMAFARAKVVPAEEMHSSGVPLNVLQYAGLYDAGYADLFDIPRPW